MLQREDWLALRFAAVHENNLLPILLVLHKEMKPNLTTQDFYDESALSPWLDFQNSFGSLQ